MPFVTTLLGRNRPLPDLMSADRRRSGQGSVGLCLWFLTLLYRGLSNPAPAYSPPAPRRRHHAERAAINSPIQGSAADVANSAMVAISQCPELKRMGWKLLMQVGGFCSACDNLGLGTLRH